MKLSVIIVNWNTAAFLRGCLESLLACELAGGLEVIVIDNASEDESVLMLRHQFPSVRLIINSENAGFARANNQGLEIASGEYVLLLNTDTVILNKQIFNEWLTFMNREKEVAASGCRLVFTDGSNQVGDAGFKPGIRTAFNYCFFLSKFFPEAMPGLFLNHRGLDHVMDVDWVCGAAFMVRRSILSQVGLMDTGGFMYGEDVEWGCRMRSFGHRVCYLPHISIVHYQGGSFKMCSGKTEFPTLWLQNLRIIYIKIHQKPRLLLYDALMTLTFILRWVMYLLSYAATRREAVLSKAEQMKAYIKFSWRPQG